MATATEPFNLYLLPADGAAGVGAAADSPEGRWWVGVVQAAVDEYGHPFRIRLDGAEGDPGHIVLRLLATGDQRDMHPFRLQLQPILRRARERLGVPRPGAPA